MVSGSRWNARGFSAAHLRVATAISASCSLVVPYWCMCRVAASAYAAGGDCTPYGRSHCQSGNQGSSCAGRAETPRLRLDRRVSPCVISATSHAPALIACTASCT